MTQSLRWQVTWPWLIALFLVAGWAYGHRRQTIQSQKRLVTIYRTQDTLDAILGAPASHHRSIMGRARDALFERDIGQRADLIAWAAENYLIQMNGQLNKAAERLTEVRIPTPHPSWRNDIARLEKQLVRVRERTEEVSQALAVLLEQLQLVESEADAAELEDTTDVETQPSADDWLQALQRLERADSAVRTSLRFTSGLAHRAIAAQMNWRRDDSPLWHHLLGWAALAWLPLALLLTLRSAAAIRSLTEDLEPVTADDTDTQSRTEEERRLRNHLRALASWRQELDTQLSAANLSIERAQSQRRRSDQELGLLRLYNENLVNSLRAAIVVTDADGMITGINRRAREVLGIKQDDLQQDIRQQPLFVAIAARTTADQAIDKALQDCTPVQLQSVPYVHGDTTLVLDCTIAPYQDERGKARGLLWVADDVTEAVHTKNQLLAAERLATVGRLSSQVAHEVRNPLSAIGLNAELLEDEFVPGMQDEARRNEALQLLRAIGKEIERLTEVTEGYLHLARMPSPHTTTTDVNALLSDLSTMLAAEMRQADIEVRLDLSDTPRPFAVADPGQLRQGLLNIIRNSREAMPEGGVLEINTRSTEAWVEIEVCDHGPGIPPEVAARVFEPFYTTKPQGTGLGLSLTHQIMTHHGGEIEIAATSDHPGTRVTLRLPRSK